MRHPTCPTRASSTGLSSLCLWPTEFPGHLPGKNIGSIQGIGLCRGILSQARSSMQSCQGAPTMHGPIDDHQWGWCYGGLPVEACWGGIRIFLHPRREDHILGEGDGPSGAPDPAPQQAKNPRFVEPAKQTTIPIISTAPYCHPSLKRGKSWEGINVNPNNTSQRVSIYLKKDSQLPEWWEEFQPLIHSADRCCCNDTLAKHLACQQALAFHLLTAQKEVHGTWLAPSSLSELKRKEHQGPKDPQLMWDYHEVWKEETVVLAVVLQQCVVWARAPPDTFCRAVQELHRCLTMVMEEGNWINMEKEIWEGLWKTPWLLQNQGLPHQKEYHCRHPIGEAHNIYFTRTSICIWAIMGGTPSRPGSSTKEAATTPQVFFPGPRGPYHTTFSRCLPARSPNLVWSLHPGIAGGDHLPHPSNGQSPLSPSGSKPG